VRSSTFGDRVGVNVHVAIEFHATIFRITVLTSLPHLFVKVLLAAGVAVPKSKIGDRVVGLGTLQASNGLHQAVFLDAFVETLVLELFWLYSQYT
jgi:hypothetical protein